MNWQFHLLIHLLRRSVREETDRKNNPEKYENGTTLDNVLAFGGAILFGGLGIYLLGTNILGIIFGIILILLSILTVIAIVGIRAFVGTILVILLIIGLIAFFRSHIFHVISITIMLIIVIILKLMTFIGIISFLFIAFFKLSEMKDTVVKITYRVIYIILAVMMTIVFLQIPHIKNILKLY